MEEHVDIVVKLLWAVIAGLLGVIVYEFKGIKGDIKELKTSLCGVKGVNTRLTILETAMAYCCGRRNPHIVKVTEEEEVLVEG